MRAKWWAVALLGLGTVVGLTPCAVAQNVSRPAGSVPGPALPPAPPPLPQTPRPTPPARSTTFAELASPPVTPAQGSEPAATLDVPLPGTPVGSSGGTALPAPKPAGRTPAADDGASGDKATTGDKKDDAGKAADAGKGLTDSLHTDDNYGFKALFDSLHRPGKKSSWYEKMSIRGYTQFRFGRTIDEDEFFAEPNLLGDRSINGRAENFSIRRARLILSGDISDHLFLYFQPDFASVPTSTSNSTFFAQLRDLYGDVYLTTDKVHRLRVGLSKVPYGWENMQSSQNRVPLDRTDPINTGVSPNERDLGVFYYWTPEDKQRLLRDLVDGGLKGSGNYGILGLGVYNGQGGSQIERNLNLHTVARVTWPWRLPDGQVVEASLQGYTGKYVVSGTDIRPLGVGDAITPEGTGDRGFTDQRVAGSFVWYPQPLGFQAEWNVGAGPGLNDAQTAVELRSLHGGYLMAMYKYDTPCHGIFTPYARWQYYKGGYRSIANAPYGTHEQWDLGVEWQIRREMELAVEYSLVDGVNLIANDDEGARSYRNFKGSLIRLQFQINY